MTNVYERKSSSDAPAVVPPPRSVSETVPMLTPSNAWRVLCRRTGASIGRSTFYRWVNSGRVYAVRMGYRFYIPWPALEDVIKRCLEGERF